MAIADQQIYLDTITDLLNPQGSGVDLREDPKSGVYVDGAKVSASLSTLLDAHRGRIERAQGAREAGGLGPHTHTTHIGS
jgi:hypothetical protein